MTEYNLGHVVGEKGPKGDTGPQGPQGEKGDPGTITIDTSLSTTSTNAVQNKAITKAINKKVNNSDIVNNLTTIDPTKVLAATQGKVLKDYVDGLVGDIENDMLL